MIKIEEILETMEKDNDSVYLEIEQLEKEIKTIEKEVKTIEKACKCMKIIVNSSKKDIKQEILAIIG